jgi:hypothetical protein
VHSVDLQHSILPTTCWPHLPFPLNVGAYTASSPGSDTGSPAAQSVGRIGMRGLCGVCLHVLDSEIERGTSGAGTGKNVHGGVNLLSGVALDHGVIDFVNGRLPSCDLCAMAALSCRNEN